MEFTYALRFEFTATNNEAEYEALLAGLRIAARMGVTCTTKKRIALSKIRITSFAHLSKLVLVEIFENKSISEMEIYTVIEEQDPPDNPIVDYISKGTLPHEQNMPRRITPAPAQRIELRDGVLPIDVSRVLRHGYLCVGPIQADYVLCEIHAGSCSMHSGPRSVVARALRSGYYWPTMHRDARDMIKKLRGLENSYVAITTLLNGIEAKRSATITGNQTNGLLRSKSKARRRNQNASDRHKAGDFVYRANDASHAEDTGKLRPKWEGPYEVTEALGKGAYKLRDMDGHELPRTWNTPSPKC
ncbi:reverse transcriptase domain-containing protein [Tanacetum coccineum]